MSAGSRIEWTDRTWNPIVGCTRVSAGCENCYAERMAARLSGNPQTAPYHGIVRSGPQGPRWSGDVRFLPDLVTHPLRWRKPQRVFVNSMSDLFHERVPFDVLDKIFTTMALARAHTFQVLTKRPERMRAYMEHLGVNGVIGYGLSRCFLPHNVHLGVSVEDQATADERVPQLLATRAAVRFVSYEPALGPIDFRQLRNTAMLGEGQDHINALAGSAWTVSGDYVDTCSIGARLDQVIVGGESGPGARPCDIEWIRSTIADCKAESVPVFVKQLGRRPVRGALRINVTDYHGGEPREWPADLRVREMPA